MEFIKTRMTTVQVHSISIRRQHFISLTAKLDAMSPLKVLTRGYAMVQSQFGDVIRSTKQIAVNEQVKITLADGAVTAKIMEAKETS